MTMFKRTSRQRTGIRHHAQGAMCATARIAIFAAISAFFGVTALAQALPSVPATQVTPSPGGTVPMNSGQAPGTVLAQAARSVGIRRCYQAIDQVSSLVFSNAQHADVVLDWDRNAPDAGPFFSLSGMDFREGAAVLSLTTTPGLAGGCSILAERISSAPLSCKTVAHTELAGYQATPLVQAVTVYMAPAHPRETVTLVDVPPSCLIVRRQVQFGWGAAQ